ncbi:MAG: hypothetical protein ABR586_00965, partial [Thermoplasmatota archaeon]
MNDKTRTVATAILMVGAVALLAPSGSAGPTDLPNDAPGPLAPLTQSYDWDGLQVGQALATGVMMQDETGESRWVVPERVEVIVVLDPDGGIGYGKSITTTVATPAPGICEVVVASLVVTPGETDPSTNDTAEPIPE